MPPSRTPCSAATEAGCNISRMRKWALAVVVFVSACAPRPVSVPVVTALKFPEVVQPPIPPAFANSPVDALASFAAALAVDPGLTDVRRRVEVLKFRGLEQNIARARELARQGRIDEAVQAYAGAIASSPDSPFLYREIAAIERQKGSVDAALADFRKALALEPADARSLEQVAEILESRDDLEGAEKAYADALALEANPAVEKRLEALRDRMALA